MSKYKKIEKLFDNKYKFSHLKFYGFETLEQINQTLVKEVVEPYQNKTNKLLTPNDLIDALKWITECNRCQREIIKIER